MKSTRNKRSRHFSSEPVAWNHAAECFLTQPALLAVATSDGRMNLMTLTMKLIGDFLSEPSIGVLVREARHTHGMLLEAKCFSVNLGRNLAGAMDYCGHHSGRDFDKVAGSGVTLLPGLRTHAPLVAEAEWHYECETVTVLPVELGFGGSLVIGRIVGTFVHSESLGPAKANALPL